MSIKITVSLDKITILSTIKDHVILKGHYFHESNSEGEGGDCIVYFNRISFLKIIDEWIDLKKRYYEDYNHFCGTAYIYFKDIREKEKRNYLTYYKEPGKDKEIYVRTFICDDAIIDSEHG